MQNVNSFFDNYARALENYDTKGLTNMYCTPCTMMSDAASFFFNDSAKLEGFFNQGAGFYKQFGIAHVRHDLWMRKVMTEKILNVKVNWKYYDTENQPIYNCDYYYTLKLDKNDTWKIVVSVSVNEKERMEEWQVKLKSNLKGMVA